MKTNKKAKDYRVDHTEQLAGGFGANPAKQGPEALLRRAVMACMLWEPTAYDSGDSVAANIAALVPQVAPHTVACITHEARTRQKLRHVPLFIAREMARHEEHRKLLGTLLPSIIMRADEITEFMALYWRDGRCPLAKKVKLGLAKAFENFDEYQLAKYDRKNEIKLRDVLFMVHAQPTDTGNMVGVTSDAIDRKGYERGKTWRHPGTPLHKLVEGTLATPDTWEVSLSTGKDKKTTWERLITEKRIGALAFMRNLRNMQEVNVDRNVIKNGFDTINPRMLLPLNYFAAAAAAPDWMREIENLMLRGFENFPKLKGYTIFVVDVSGSMQSQVSTKSKFTRLDAAAAMTIMATECCEQIAVYATAGSDTMRAHKTEKVPPYRGFGLATEIGNRLYTILGNGGIFTRQCLEFIKDREKGVTPDRIIVFSDSQDCDLPGSGVPRPFGTRNYIIDVSSEARGINYDGIWTAEISGWSEHFLQYIAEVEAQDSLN